MTDIRVWIQHKLHENGFEARITHESEVEVDRVDLPNVSVTCVGLEEGTVFSASDLNKLLEDGASTEFVVVVPTRIAHAAYELAEERGVCVAGFGELVNALKHDADLRSHVDSQEAYERRRLQFNSHVASLKRKGHHAYQIARLKGRPLTIATSNEYEFTVDELLNLVESFDAIALDYIVVTNPNCRGFSSESLRAARQVGTKIVLFPDFLDNLDQY